VITTPLDAVAGLVRGASEFELSDDSLVALRLAAWTRGKQADRWIELWAAHTVGVRLVTVTAARHVSIVASVTRMVPADADSPIFPTCVVATIGKVEVARAEVTAGPVILNLPDRSWQEVVGPRSLIELDLGPTDAQREVTIWLTHNGQTVIHEVRSDAPLEPAPVSTRAVWLHHGSSVSHCLEATSPLGPWPQLAAHALDLELTNLAIAGNAQLDPFVARTIAAQQADVISLKLGVNIINADSMRRRAFVPALHGFLDLVREGHPHTPIVVMTPIVSPAIEDIPGPTRKFADGFYRGTPREIAPGDGTLTLGIVRQLVLEAVAQRAQSDPLLFGFDGLTLFAAHDAAMLWDGLHPNQQGYHLIASRFVAAARDSTTGVGRAFSAVL